MTSGTVSLFDLHEGCGVIIPDDGHGAVRVHRSAIEQARLGQLAAGQRLAFDLERIAGEARAVNLDAPFSGR